MSSDSSAQDLAQDEMARQHTVLTAEAPIRLLGICAALGLTAFFLPLAIPLSCALTNGMAEAILLRLTHNADVLRDRGRYLTGLAAAFAASTSFMMPPALVFQMDSPLAKPLAVGMAMAALLHSATTRAVHLPFALAGIVGTALTVFATNAVYWWDRDEPGLFALTTGAAISMILYVGSATVHAHRLHRDAARGRIEARAADAAKGRFLAEMSHELRTPLNAVLGLGHAELGRSVDPLSRERLSVMITAADGLRTMLEDILDTAMAEAGRLPLRPVRAGPIAEVTATVALFSPVIEAEGLELRLTVRPGLPDHASFDPHRLRQCLSNLLSNAAKHTRRGTIAVTAGPDPDHPRRMRIVVGDTGPGVPVEDRTRIFQPFGGVAGSVTGRGLGLSISRQFARMMGGDLTLMPPDEAARLAAGEGLTGAAFVLTVALDPAEAEPTAHLPTCPGMRRRVLVVDDIATNRLVAVAHLSLLGFEAEEAASGPDALARIAAGPVPDLVLLDMAMPGMDGAEMLTRLRAMAGAAGRVPVVAMTADPSVRVTVGTGGLDGYLPKPFEPDQMAAELDRLLRPTVISDHPPARTAT